VEIKSSETTEIGDPRQLGEALEIRENPRRRANAVPLSGTQRIPAGGGGPTTKPNSIFGSEGESMMAGQVPMVDRGIPERPERPVVVARPVMGQAEPIALEPYPQIEQVIQSQTLSASLPRQEVQAILDALNSTLARISAPENAGSACVRNLGPGAVEKATTLRNKMTAYLALNSGALFSDFTADELGGADRVLSCAGSLSPMAASQAGLILAVAVLGLSAVGIYYLAHKKKK
jgi:hypothetical protein